MPDVTADDGTDQVFINGRDPFHDPGVIPVSPTGRDNGRLVFKGNLGIRDQQGWEQGMGPAAVAAPDPADRQGYVPGLRLDGAAIVSVHSHASGHSACTGELVELEPVNHFIIRFLRQGLAKRHHYCYHSIVILNPYRPCPAATLVRKQPRHSSACGRVI